MKSLTSDVTIFDIETDGFLDVLTKIHSLVIWQSGELYSFHGAGIETGLRMLQEADRLVAHNGIDFDYPAIRKLYGNDFFRPDQLLLDSMTCTRVIHSDLKERDMLNSKKEGNRLPGKLIGSHSLKAWGYRLGILKGDFGEETDWQHWSEEMQTYCEQDVRVTLEIWKRVVLPSNWDERSIELEHSFAGVIHEMTQNGIGFNEDRAVELYREIGLALDLVRDELQAAFPPIIETMKTPAYYEAPGGERFERKNKAPKPLQKFLTPGPMRTKEHPFNPGSRDQIADRLKEKGWKPQAFTKTGKPKVDDEVLESVDIPEAQLIAKYLLMAKRVGQLAEGDEAWLHVVKSGKIHGYVNTNGAVTGRCSHSKPNVAQVPRVKTKKVTEVIDGAEVKKDVLMWGEEAGWSTDFRALFRPTRQGWYQVGADASGLELRVLAHYLGRYDRGKYTRVILDDDIHCHNRNVFGLPSTKEGRNLAKTGVYCLIYGGGDEKLGFSLGELLQAHERRAQSTRLQPWQIRSLKKKGPATPERVAAVKRGVYARGRVMAGIDGYEDLVTKVNAAVDNKGHLLGLDGRRLQIRKKHAALNTLLQSGGALIVKYATVLMRRYCDDMGLVYGKDWALMAHVHDEIQAETRSEDIAKEVGTAFVNGLKTVEQLWNLRCPLDGEFDVGRDWAATH